MTEFRLGKQEYMHSPLTLRLARYILPDIHVPEIYDFDKTRKPFPFRVWGNDAWGDCVIGGRANHLLRLERVEQRRTIPLFDHDAVSLYQQMTGSQAPEDDRDAGLVVLDAMRQWRNEGWTLAPQPGVRQERNYKIWAYGELDPQNHDELRTAIYTLHGIHMGFWLPIAAQRMTANSHWDYNGESGPEWQPGSWGGHLVYAKAYNKNGVEVITWGQKVLCSWNFIDQFCDEAWGVVDSNDSWRVKQTIDVSKLMDSLKKITTLVNE